MPNTRAFCDQQGNEHALVLPLVEVRDNLGNLAVQILAAREDLTALSYGEMLNKLLQIVNELHNEFEHNPPTL